MISLAPGIVVHDRALQRAPASPGRSGRRPFSLPMPSQTVNVNVVPTPGSLSSQICPPMSSTRRRQTVSPNPVCAAVLARRRHVGLGKGRWLEQLGHLILRHADAGVAHRELELALVAPSAPAARRTMTISPVSGDPTSQLADEVVKDLSQSVGIASAESAGCPGRRAPNCSSPCRSLF